MEEVTRLLSAIDQGDPHAAGQLLPLAEHDVAVAAPPDDLLAVDEALTRLAAEDPAAAEVVKLRFYMGLSVEEAADALAIARASAYRHWAYARAWLRCALQDEA